MKSKKSTGHDNISSNLVKSLKGELAYPLSVMINNSLATGTVPEAMKTYFSKLIESLRYNKS